MANAFKPTTKRKSFFAEQRESNTNPNFINNLDFIFLRQNVRRIIKDISDGAIIPEDYVYFSSNNVINAVLQESYEQYQSNKTLRLALQSYISIVLPMRYVTPNVDINTEYTTAGNELSKATERENVWMVINNIFNAIANGSNPNDVLINISRIPKNSSRNL